MKRLISAAVAATLLAAPARADITVGDAYLRSSTPSSVSGAAFMVVMNHGAEDDRLIGVTSDVATRVELHRHTEDANGVMRMSRISYGITVPAGGKHILRRGGDHMMFMGLSAPLEQDSEVAVTLTFEQSGEIEVMIPVDHDRKVDHSAMMHDD